MIKLQNYTPDVYYSHSRDFQFIGRLYDVVLNSIKTNADTLYNLPFSDEMNPKLVDLLALTLGFKLKHQYNVAQLTSLCSTFVKCLRNKGNRQSIEMACNALSNAEGIKEKIEFEIDEESSHVDFFVPEDLSDVNLLKDTLEYILPAGMTYSIIRSVLKKTGGTTELIFNQSVNYSRSPIKDAETAVYISKINKKDKWKILPGQQAGWLSNSTIVSPSSDDLVTPSISLSGSILNISNIDYRATQNDIYVEQQFEKSQEVEPENNSEQSEENI